MEYIYEECETCGRKGDPYCIGCMPTMMSDGSFSRSLYTPHKCTITFTTQVTSPATEGEDDGGDKITCM